MTYVLDTHPVVWFLETSQRLSVGARNRLRDPRHTFILPTIVLVEITYLYTKGRIEIAAAMVQQRLVSASNCVLYPLDEQVAMLIPTELNIHDAIIVATALVYRDILTEPVAVITKNGEITRSGLIDTVW
jgi:PIN domain nuclease of toxin-antitoxin system